MIQTAVIGLGWWGRHIIETLHGHSDKILIKSAFDVFPDQCIDFCLKRNISLKKDFDEVLQASDIEAVILATPHSIHENQIIASAEAGKHIFCEKPLALTYRGAQFAVDACEKAGVKLGIGHERRFEPAMLEISRLVKGGELGKIMHVEANFSHDKLANLESENWRLSKKESPGAAMTATGIHITDAFISMFGSVEQVFAITETRNPANLSGDILNFSLRFKAGLTGTFNSVLETPLYMRFAVFGSRAWVEARDYTHPSQNGPTDFFISRQEGKVDKTTFPYVDTVKKNFEAWADAISGKAEYPISNVQKIENILVFEAICHSAEFGEPVKPSQLTV